MKPVRSDIVGLARACRQLLEFDGSRSALEERRRGRMAAAGGSLPAPEAPPTPPAYLACLLDLAELEAAVEMGAVTFELTADELAGLTMLRRVREQFLAERQSCPKCGRAVPSGWAICRHCGELLGDAALKAPRRGERSTLRNRSGQAPHEARTDG